MILNSIKHEAITCVQTNHDFSFPVKDSIELFGLVIDKGLNFNEHITNICVAFWWLKGFE